MPPINPGRENTNFTKRRRRKEPERPAPSFARPVGEKPFTVQRQQAQQNVRRARRRLPVAPIAAPPVITRPAAGRPRAQNGAEMPRAQVEQFLASQSRQAQAARQLIVTSIRRNVGDVHGRERVQALDRLMDEIATDPRHARTRAAIRHWTAVEASGSRPQSAVARPGPQPRRARIGVGPLAASVNLTATGQALAGVVEKAAPGLAASANTPEGRFFRAGLSDVAHLPLMTPQMLYEIGAAAKEAAGGDTTRAKRLAEGFTQGVYGLAVQGKWGELEDYVREHPVFAFLELRGGKGVGGRGAGAVMRSGVVGERARRAASTQRADIGLAEAGTAARVADRQHYSPDVFTKAVQVLAERRRGGAGKTALRDHRLRRRADFESDTAAQMSRAVRQDEAVQAQAAKPKGPLADVVGLATQGVVRARSIEADLRKELARLDAAHSAATNARGVEAALSSRIAANEARLRSMKSGTAAHRALSADTEALYRQLDAARKAQFSTGAQRRQNRQNAMNIRRVLDSPDAMRRLGEIAQSGRENVRAINRLEGEAVRLGAITPERAERAALFPAAQAHLGAEYSDAPFRAARGREVAAGRALRSAQTQQRQARVTYARANATAQRNLAEKRRQYLRRDETYAKLETQLGQAKARREKLRAAAREAEATGEPVTVRLGGAEIKLSAPEARSMLDAASSAQRSAASALASRARVLHEKPLTHTISRGPRKGQRVLTSKATVKRAERKVLAARAARDKPTTQTVPRARAEFDAARRERQAAQAGGTRSLNVAGQRLSNEQIRQVVGEDVAYLPHHTKARGARAYYQTAFAGRKNLDAGQKRTGAAFHKGADDRSYQAIVEHRVRMRGVVNRIAEHDRIVHSVAIKGPGGQMFTWDQAEKIASNAADRGAKLVPYRAIPGSYDKTRIAQIAARQDAADTPELAKVIEHEFAERLKEPPAGDRAARNVVLVPEQIVNQLKEQHAVSGTRGKAGNVAVDVFRRTVLPFSTKWLAGNVIEAGVRLGAVGAGPNAYRIGRRLLKEIEKLDRDEAMRVRAALTGGLLYGNRGLTVKRVSEHFEGTALAAPAKAVSVAGQLPVVRQLGRAIVGFTDGVFALNRWVESAAQTAALGKHAKREMQELTGSWAKATRAQERALQDVARGMLDTKNVHDAARYIDQTLGQYSRFSPTMRRFIQQAAPFLPWYLNSARWVFWTLPAKHPIKTGLMANVAANLQADFDASHDSLPPGDLRGEIVLDDGTVIPLARFTPFGAFGSVLGGGDEQLTALLDPLFPQFKSAGLATLGLNFSGHRAKLDARDRSPDGGVGGAVRASMAFNSLLEAFVPAVGIAKRVREGGSTGYDNSTLWSPKTKPGTKIDPLRVGGRTVLPSGPRRVLDPFRSVPGIKGGSRGTVAPARPSRQQQPAQQDDLWNAMLGGETEAPAVQQPEDDELWGAMLGG